jgi:hypothetical protein
MLARTEAAAQHGRQVDHADRLLIGAVGDRLGWADDDAFCTRALVHQHQRECQTGGVRCLRGPLRRQSEDVADVANLRNGIPGAECRADNIAKPWPGRIAEPRQARHVGQLQLVEDRETHLRFALDQSKIRNERPPLAETILPVDAAQVPHWFCVSTLKPGYRGPGSVRGLLCLPGRTKCETTELGLHLRKSIPITEFH